MSSRSRFILPLAAALLLGAALAVRLWPASESPPVPSGAPSAPPAPAEAVAPRPAVAPGPVVSVEAAPARVEVGAGPGGTVVPVGPGDVVPEPEVADPPPQENDPIEPEKPQTPEWRHEKVVRVTELLGRDVERLEREREAAAARGDEAEAKRLETVITRSRARLVKLREEARALAEAAGLPPAE